MQNKIIALLAVVFLAMPAMAAKKKAEPQQPTGNWLDLRNELFACNEQGCAMPVRGILIGCDAQGCRPISDILVPTGPVKRFTPQIPAAEAPKPAEPVKK